MPKPDDWDLQLPRSGIIGSGEKLCGVVLFREPKRHRNVYRFPLVNVAFV